MSGGIYYANLAANGLVEGFVIALTALSITLVFGIARFPNAATGDYMTLGAYAALGTQALAGAPIWLSAAGGMATTAAVALFFYVWVFRQLDHRSIVARLIASIGIAFFLRSVLTLFVGTDQRVFDAPLVRALDFGGVRLLPSDLMICAVAVAALAAVFGLLHLTPVGRRMRAVADNPDLARASGIRARSVMLIMWLLAGAVAGLAGTLIGLKSVVTPVLGWDLLLPGFAAAILGGVGSPVGAVIGGLAIGLLQELSTPLVGFTYKIAIAFLVLVVMLLLRPQGLFGNPVLVR